MLNKNSSDFDAIEELDLNSQEYIEANFDYDEEECIRELDESENDSDPVIEPTVPERLSKPNNVDRFAYGSLEPAIAKKAKEAANRIRASYKNSVTAVIAIGTDLKTMKDTLDHGAFGEWIASEFEMTSRSAQNYMNAAKFAVGEYETISLLPAASVYKLTAPSTPAEVRGYAVEEIAAGRLPTLREIKAQIAEVRARIASDRHKASKNANVKPGEAEKAKSKAERILEDQQTAAADAIALFEKCLGDQLVQFRDLCKTARLTIDSAFTRSMPPKRMPTQGA